MEWYNKSAEDALRELNADAAQGLSEAGAKHRLERYGENAWPQKNGNAVLDIVLAQLTDLLAILAIVSMLLALFAGQYFAALLFFLTAAIRVVPGILQDREAGRAVQSLEGITPPTAKVLRDGKVDTLETKRIVPGDIILLEAGDVVPADLRLFRAQSLQIDESIITGSTTAVYKEAEAVLPEPSPVGDRVNMAYAGSAVIYGRGQGVVVATGARTELGQAADLLHNTPASRSVGRLRGLGQGIGLLCLAGWIILIIVSLARGGGSTLLSRMTAYASVTLPAGLALVTTLSLMFGMDRLRRHGAQLKRLTAAESLGAVSVICSDKSGTLTKNEMTVTLLWTGNRLTTVSGTGYKPRGSFRTPKGETVQPLRRRDLLMTLTAAALCNNAALEETAPDTWSAVGNPTEAALVALVGKAGLDKGTLDTAFPRVAEIPFDPARRMMTTIHRGNHYPIAYTKGAADVVVYRCDEIELDSHRERMTDEQRKKILAIEHLMSEQAMRVLAVAYREFSASPEASSPEDLENHLVFLGLIGMLDPARPDSREAVDRCRRAGIRTILVTAETRDTAQAVAKDVGILTEDGGEVLTGQDLDGMPDEVLEERVKTAAVFACVTAQHKQRILDALHAGGEVVALTGDGVSDVPLLRHADVGVAKGRTGTEIARSAADLVVDDDKFSTLVSSVGEGRTMYENIRRVAKYLLGTAAAGAVTALAAGLAGAALPFPPAAALLAGMILFALPAAVIGRQAGERDAMKRPPRSLGTAPVNWAMVTEIAGQTVIQSVLCLIMMIAAPKIAPEGISPVTYRTSAVFTLFVFGTLLCAFSARYARTPMWRVGKTNQTDSIFLAGAVGFGLLVHILVMCVPALRGLFGYEALGWRGWGLVILLSLATVALAEIFKLMLMPIILSAFPMLEKGPKKGLQLLPDWRLLHREPDSGTEEDIDIAEPLTEAPPQPEMQEMVELNDEGDVPEELAETYEQESMDEVGEIPGEELVEDLSEEELEDIEPEELQEMVEMEPDEVKN